VQQEIEELTNPKVKTGKKTLTPEQTQMKAQMLGLLDAVRDESSKDAAVRLVFEPKNSRISQSELSVALLAHTSLETSAPINMTMVGLDGKPVQKSLRLVLGEWLEFRQTTITRRSQHRLAKVLDRIHILEGRQLVLLNIDEVIRIIRESEDPKAALIARFRLSDRQAEDILEIRLRQLARLEAIKIEQELAELRSEQAKLEEILASPAALRRLMIKEIEQDAKAFGDTRRTLIQAEKKAVAEVKVADEPVTVVISALGWVRARTGHGHDPAGFGFKAGDALYGTFECRTVDTLLVFGDNGRVYSVGVDALPGARGDGQPITSLIELEAGSKVLHYFAGPPSAQLLLAASHGYGFIASVENMTSRQKAGKAFISLESGQSICRPSPLLIYIAKTPENAEKPAQAASNIIAITNPSQTDNFAASLASHVACASADGRFLTFAISEVKTLEKGGKGLQLMALEKKDRLAGAAAYARSVIISGTGRGGKAKTEQLEIRSLNNALASRAKKGKDTAWGFKAEDVVRME
jgi:topoisomerase-4 subunit A